MLGELSSKLMKLSNIADRELWGSRPHRLHSRWS
jgi:hypothetical protein